MPRSVVAGSTVEVVGGEFIVIATPGQPDAAVSLDGGDYRVQGGFWPEPLGTSPTQLFSDGFE